MMVKLPSDAPLLSRSVLVDDLPDHGLSVTIEPTAAEREALRALNGLVALSSMKADFLVRRLGRAGAVVTGTVVAEVVQTCVVSLDPFDAAVHEPVEAQFLGGDALDKWRAERAAHPVDPQEPDDEDEPDAIVDGSIDLGVVAAEYLTLGLDPYPKKPGVRFEDVAPDVSDGKESPFAALKALRAGDP